MVCIYICVSREYCVYVYVCVDVCVLYHPLVNAIITLLVMLSAIKYKINHKTRSLFLLFRFCDCFVARTKNTHKHPPTKLFFVSYTFLYLRTLHCTLCRKAINIYMMLLLKNAMKEPGQFTYVSHSRHKMKWNGPIEYVAGCTMYMRLTVCVLRILLNET